MMRGLIFAIAALCCFPLAAQVSSVPASQGPGGTGTSNISCTFATSATSCAITGLTIPSASYNSAVVQCYVGASTSGATQTPLSITWAPTIVSSVVTTVTASFSAASGAGYCALNTSGINGAQGAAAALGTPVVKSADYQLVAGDSANTLVFKSGTFTNGVTLPAAQPTAPWQTQVLNCTGVALPVTVPGGFTVQYQGSTSSTVTSLPEGNVTGTCPAYTIIVDPSTGTNYFVRQSTGNTGAAGSNGSPGSPGAAGAGYAATSTTSLAEGTGSTVFTTQSGLAYSVGARARASSAANTANYMEGLVTSYSGTSLTVNVDTVGGSGTHADWNINVAGNVGAQGPAGANGTGNNTYCADATGSTTTYTCPTPSPTVTSLTGLIIAFTPQASSSGAATVNVAGLGAKALKQADGTTDLTVTAGNLYILGYNGTVFSQGAAAASAGVASFNSRTGAVSPTSGDYTAAQVTNAVSKTASNTYTTGDQDCTSCTSLTVPSSGGAAPTGNGKLAYDTTQGAWSAGGQGAQTGHFPRVLYATHNTSDTLSAATISTNETNFATTYQIPANYLISDKQLRVTACFLETTSGSPPTIQLAVRLGAVGVGGTLTYQGGALAPTASLTGANNCNDFLIGGEAAAGASANTDTSLIGTGALNWNAVRNTIAQPVALATNGALNINVTIKYSANTAGNTVTLYRFSVTEIN